MIFKLTARGCRISKTSERHIRQHLKKISQSLPNIEEDLVVLRMMIKRNIDRYHPPRVHPHLHKTYSDSKPALAYFEGAINFRLTKKRLYVHFKGQTIDECIDHGFSLIFRELEKFKDLHFIDESEYPDHSSIRGGI